MGDVTVGALVLLAVLVVALGAGWLVHRVGAARRARIWGPLVAVVDGTVRGDGRGAGRSSLRGRYGDQAVEASCAPQAGDSAFEISLGNVPGGHDWRLLGPRGPDEGWQLESDAEALRLRLAASDLIRRVAVLGRPGPALTAGRLPVLAYDAGHRVLHYREDAGPGTVPSADRFRAQLDVLIAVARLSAAANR